MNELDKHLITVPEDYYDYKDKKSVIKEFIKKFIRLSRLDLDFFYDKKFANSPGRDKPFAKQIADTIINEFSPKSVIDIGCGTGDILKQFEDNGIKVLGVDGSKHCYNNRKINNLVVYDIRNGAEDSNDFNDGLTDFTDGFKFDLTMCVEVGEHIEHKYAQHLVNQLCSLSDTVLFSSASEHIRGIEHVNCQPRQYWVEKFELQGFKLNESQTMKLRTELAKIEGIYFYYVNDMLIFER